MNRDRGHQRHFMLDPPRLEASRRRNKRQSFALLLAMALLLGTVGWLLAGAATLVWAAAAGVVVLIVGTAAPTNLVLRFYRAEILHPDLAPRLFPVVAELSRRAGLKTPPRLFLIPGETMQALSLGSSVEPVIALSNGLLRRLNLSEIAAIIGHEISHIVHNDLGVMALAETMSRLTRVLSLAGLFLVALNLPLIATGHEPVSWALILVLVIAPTICTLLQLALSRSREFDADLGAVELTGDPEALASALRHIEGGRRRSWGSMILAGGAIRVPPLLRTHPASHHRISRLLALAAEKQFDRSWWSDPL
ncbi:MAG: zinc metalloprotease HtpX [Sphingomonadales bacterium]